MDECGRHSATIRVDAVDWGERHLLFLTFPQFRWEGFYCFPLLKCKWLSTVAPWGQKAPCENSTSHPANFPQLLLNSK